MPNLKEHIPSNIPVEPGWGVVYFDHISGKYAYEPFYDDDPDNQKDVIKSYRVRALKGEIGMFAVIFHDSRSLRSDNFSEGYLYFVDHIYLDGENTDDPKHRDFYRAAEIWLRKLFLPVRIR